MKVLESGSLGANFKNGGCEIRVRPAGHAVDLGPNARVEVLKYGTPEEFAATIEHAARVIEAEGFWGPLGASTYFDYRLKLDHLDDKPFPGEPHNTQDAIDCFEKAGFQVEKRYRSHELKLDFRLTRRLNAVALFSLGARGLANVTRESLNVDSLMKNSAKLYELTHEMFKEHFGYEAVGPEIFAMQILARLSPVICWKTSFILRSENGELIGYSLHLRDPHDPGRICLKTFGIDPRLKDRARAFFSLLKVLNDSLQGTYDRAVFCLIAEGDTTDRLAEKCGPLKSMTYGLYYRKSRGS